ncbi:MAG: hypothetical protein Q9167_003586 [Letrouitia subvulpina]
MHARRLANWVEAVVMAAKKGAGLAGVVKRNCHVTGNTVDKQLHFTQSQPVVLPFLTCSIPRQTSGFKGHKGFRPSSGWLVRAMDSMDDIYADPQKLFKAMAGENPNLPVPTFLSFQEAKQKARQYSKDIFASKQALVSLLDRHEETVIKRWTKKTTLQRQKVLRTAFPDIPATHRPDFWALSKENPAQIRSQTRYRDYWLLPSLNVEDLSKPRNLLLFLLSRARNPPGVFVISDANSVHIGHVSQAIMPAYLSGYTMLLAGQHTQETYGRMISWDDDAQAFDMMSKGTGLQPGEGLQVMEIQQRKMQFLQKCLEIILQDLLVGSHASKQPTASHDLLARSASERPSLTQEIEEAPYKVPDVFDVARLRIFVEARRNEAEGHIWSLREDPSYFQGVVMEGSEHRQERILTASGKAHPVLGQSIFWERVLGNVVVNAYMDFVGWVIALDEIDYLISMQSKHSGHTGSNLELPEDFTRALAHFEYFISQLTKGAVSKWKVGMVASPPLRQYYVREPQDPNNTRIVVMTKDRSRKKKDHLIWLLEVFLQDEQLHLCGLENVCDELEREICANRSSQARISPYVASLISEFSLIGELKRQLELTTPGPRMVELLEDEEKKAEFSRKTKLLSQVYNVFTDVILADVGTPLNKFYYPSNKRRTPETTQKMQQAENNLDIFWARVDDYCEKTAGKRLHQILRDVLKERQLQRTSDWVELSDKPQRKNADGELDNASSKLATLELEKRTEKTVTPTLLAQENIKPKTRGTPRVLPSTEAKGIDTVVPTKDVTPIFNVSKRGFKVFTTLFYTPTEEEPPGEIPWSEFLSAMASVGFSIQKLGGSAWVFAPTNDEWKQSIIFHEPHPESRISFQVARRFGRRLWRTYGWSSENFRRAKV